MSEPTLIPSIWSLRAIVAHADVWDFATAGGVLAGAAIYALGVARVWSRAGRWRGFTPGRLAAYVGGLVTVVVALLSPLDLLSDLLFSAHMSQHELLMLVAAPLIVLGRPVMAALWAAPPAARDQATLFLQSPAARRAWHVITHPVVVLLAHAAALWIWHVPWLFEGALAHSTVHALQHASFFLTAALFWYALADGRYGRGGYGMAAVFVFLTSLHSGLLGTLITLAGRVWYPVYGPRAQAMGVDPLDDQQLAGLIMWIPAGVIFLVLGLALFAAWLGEAERRGRVRGTSQSRAEAAAPAAISVR